RRFSEQTNDYLLRSHLVLLEVANADSVPASPGLKQASIGLLRDTKLARQVAGELDDERLQTLVAEIESVMREIASLSGSDDSESIDRVRAYLNNSGVLDQLEVMRMAPARLAEDRSRV
ncbi:MAG TPA: hypothetical protein VFP98_03450, partial [Candidatus Polarisedimenticolia bacterium]|nr:hypothetical protein [Candidatus Polarisedimenticolia bacterium]